MILKTKSGIGRWGFQQEEKMFDFLPHRIVNRKPVVVPDREYDRLATEEKAKVVFLCDVPQRFVRYSRHRPDKVVWEFDDPKEGSDYAEYILRNYSDIVEPFIDTGEQNEEVIPTRPRGRPRRDATVSVAGKPDVEQPVGG